MAPLSFEADPARQRTSTALPQRERLIATV
jgi:hypothetical protein